MNKLKRIFAFVLALVGVLSLAACQKDFEAILELSATRDTVEVNASFSVNEDIISGKAVPHAKLYEVLEKDDEKFVEDKNLTLNSKYTAGSVTFEKLTAGKDYVVYLYIKLDNKDNRIDSKKIKTLNNGQNAEDPFKITNAEEFQQMGKDPDGYYELANDIDFENNILDDQFSSSNKFEGHFDGKGHTIKNFKIKSASNAGVFGYTNKATIKNLNIQDAKIELGGGRSTTNMGILVGRADDTVIENVTIENTNIELAANSSAEIALGTVVGYSENSSFKNITVKNTAMNVTKSRVKVSLGLFAGVLTGQKSNDLDFFVKDCYASGSINAVMHYPSAPSGETDFYYTFIGGFVGNLGADGLIEDSAVVVDIVVTKSEEKSHANEFILAIGGFVGFNNVGSINIERCAAVANIEAYAGKNPNEPKPEAQEGEATPEAPVDLNTVKMSTEEVYIGGFIGRAKWIFNKITKSAYVVKSKEIVTQMLPKETIHEEGKDDVEKQLLYLGTFAGQTTNPEKLTENITPETENPNYGIFTENIQNIIKNKAL